MTRRWWHDLPVIHRVTSLDLPVQPWSWPFAETRRAEISAHFAEKQREKPNMWNGRVLLGRDPVFAGARLSCQLFRDRFCQLPGLARLGLSRQGRVQRLRHGRACAAPTARSCSAKWDSTPPTPGASIFRPARPISTTSGMARSIYPAAWRVSSRRRPVWRRGEYRSEPDWHCVFTGPAMAMIRILHVDMPGDALRARIEANLALQQLPELSAIHLVRGTRDLTAAMPGFVTAFIEAQLARQP